MRLIALALALLGLFILYGSFLTNPSEFESSSLEALHREVALSGFVSSERIISPDFRILSVNNLSVICSCSTSYLHKTVSIVGLIDSYEGSPQIKVLSIGVLRIVFSLNERN